MKKTFHKQHELSSPNYFSWVKTDPLGIQIPQAYLEDLYAHSVFSTYISTSFVSRPSPFLPFVCIQNNTWKRKTGTLIFADLRIPCIIVNANGRSKRGRPGTKVTYPPQPLTDTQNTGCCSEPLSPTTTMVLTILSRAA